MDYRDARLGLARVDHDAVAGRGGVGRHLGGRRVRLVAHRREGDVGEHEDQDRGDHRGSDADDATGAALARLRLLQRAKLLAAIGRLTGHGKA